MYETKNISPSWKRRTAVASSTIPAGVREWAVWNSTTVFLVVIPNKEFVTSGEAG
jgi:hypothetical protein